MNPARAAGFVLGFGLLCGRATEAGLSVGENTGEARYSYPLSLPAARGRYQPSVSLEYGSSNKTDYGYGYGWGLSVPERIEVIRPTSGPTECCVTVTSLTSDPKPCTTGSSLFRLKTFI